MVPHDRRRSRSQNGLSADSEHWKRAAKSLLAQRCKERFRRVLVGEDFSQLLVERGPLLRADALMQGLGDLAACNLAIDVVVPRDNPDTLIGTADGATELEEP